ncbi:MAG: oligopeptide transporter, OPT family [Planctomycetes bacterium]|nr:oligopeptide transporter, OPT family [Planctomycetota bacterium]
MAIETEATPAHQAYVPDDTRMPELTWSALILGTALGLIFAASSLYLVLKVGMTVSASIPVAVLAITLFRAFSNAFGFRRATILENNIVQTSGSAGESIAFGVGVTMPALMMLCFNMDLARVMVVSILGGILGILAMIPLRRAFIVKMHGRPGQPGTLLYPEGVAAAQVLISGEKGDTTGATVFVGFGLAFIHKLLTIGLNCLRETVTIPIKAINQAAVFAGDMASELLGVGYIIGMRTSSIMMGGAVLGYLVIIPVIYFVGQHAPVVIPPSSEKLISNMNISELRNNYLLFIGAGCVATAGLISMSRTLPMIVRSARAGMTSMRGGSNGNGSLRRTENDLSMTVVVFGSLGLLVLLAAFLMTQVGLVSAVLGALLVLVFGFLFVTVSSRLTGEIGSSSNPISGMTTATLMVTCLIFLTLGMTSPIDRVLALSVAAVVCIAASNGGTTAQSLKTGFLVGGTPKAMQYAILFGALISALVIGGTLLAFNAAGTVYTSDPQYLPLVVKPGNDEVMLNSDLRAEYETAVADKDPKKKKLKEDYKGKEYLVLLAPSKDRIYLIDPTTGKQAWVKEPVTLTAAELDKLKQAERDGITTMETHDEKQFLVWDTRLDIFKRNRAKDTGDRAAVVKIPDGTAPEGRFLVDPATGRVAFLKDPTIGGVVEEHDGRPTTRFPAPKTKIMQIIIDGVLTLKLNWSLVLIGALIAVTLELCGVSSLAFAVGLYVPIQYSTPIFLGGLLRWGIDKYQAAKSQASISAAGDDPEARARAEIEAIRKSETSPGVLLASGYIAGGSLAGVAAAFMEFAPNLKNALNFEWVVEGQGVELSSWIAVAVFAGLVLFAVLVGTGKLFKPPEESMVVPAGPISDPDARSRGEDDRYRDNP